MSNKIANGNTNYFKKVTDFGKNVFTSEFNNTGATYNIFDFVMNNLIVLILLFIIFGMIYWGFSFFQNQRRIQQNKTISDSFQHSQLDNSEELTVKCDSMEAPRQNTKYSYTFNLIINDFYCNKGKWKCLMLKGIDMTDYEPKDCNTFNYEGKPRDINRNISPEHCFKYVL